MTVGLTGLGTDVPEGTITGSEIAGTGYTWAATALEWQG